MKETHSDMNIWLMSNVLHGSSLEVAGFWQFAPPHVMRFPIPCAAHSLSSRRVVPGLTALSTPLVLAKMTHAEYQNLTFWYLACVILARTCGLLQPTPYFTRISPDHTPFRVVSVRLALGLLSSARLCWFLASKWVGRWARAVFRKRPVYR